MAQFAASRIYHCIDCVCLRFQGNSEYAQSVSMTLFQRNAQVYFSRHGWPKDEKENEAFRAAYNETLIQFIKDMWLYAAGLAKADEKPLIRLDR